LARTPWLAREAALSFGKARRAVPSEPGSPPH
jgi:hypothetical protein